VTNAVAAQAIAPAVAHISAGRYLPTIPANLRRNSQPRISVCEMNWTLFAIARPAAPYRSLNAAATAKYAPTAPTPTRTGIQVERRA
jgi:hypothetical protein